MGICCLTPETQTGALRWLGRVRGDGDGREVQDEGDLCIPMADSYQCTAEASIIL